MKPNSSFKMSKWIKSQLALTNWKTKEEKNFFQRSMVDAELSHQFNSKKPLSKSYDNNE